MPAPVGDWCRCLAMPARVDLRLSSGAPARQARLTAGRILGHGVVCAVPTAGLKDLGMPYRVAARLPGVSGGTQTHKK
jgi:hypothetical protein